MRWEVLILALGFVGAVACAPAEQGENNDPDIVDETDETEPEVEVPPPLMVDGWVLVEFQAETEADGQVAPVVPDDEAGRMDVLADGSAAMAVSFSLGDIEVDIGIEGATDDLEPSIVSFDMGGEIVAIEVDEEDPEPSEPNVIAIDGEVQCEVHPEDEDLLICIGAFVGLAADPVSEEQQEVALRMAAAFLREG